MIRLLLILLCMAVLGLSAAWIADSSRSAASREASSSFGPPAGASSDEAESARRHRLLESILDSMSEAVAVVVEAVAADLARGRRRHAGHRLVGADVARGALRTHHAALVGVEAEVVVRDGVDRRVDDDRLCRYGRAD